MIEKVVVDDRLQSGLEWAREHWCKPLRSRSEVEHATALLKRSWLPLHADWVKNWDNYLALAAVLDARYYPDDDRTWALDDYTVLDAGVGDGSAFLQGLRKQGMRNLIGNNLDITAPRFVDGIRYEHGDITRMRFESESLHFIACLSVIEHGVDEAAFLSEAARCLKPGGDLFISTDYWQDPVDTRGQMAFGASVKVYDQAQIGALVKMAEWMGLKLRRPLELDCGERVVNWIGMDYTFLNLLFRKE